MRLKKTIPGNREFHTEHGRNLRPYYFIANLGQLLSAASLALAVFSLLRDAIAGRGMSVATSVIIAIAVLIGIFVELANRTLARPAIKPIVTRDQFAGDEDAALRHRTLTRWSRAGLFIVGGLSLGLSFMGSMDAGTMITDAPPPAPLDSLNNAATEAAAAVYAAFTNDTTVLLQPYRQRQQAAAQRFRAIKAERTKAAEGYVGCKAAAAKYCRKMRRGILAEIDKAEAAYNATVAAIAIERGATLTSAMQRRDAALTTATGKSDSAADEAKAKAKAAADEAEAEASKTGYIFAVLTLAGQLVFYLMFYLILTIEAGSKIGEDLEPNEFSNLPTVWSDFKATLSHRVERGARRFIAYVFGERERLEKPLPYVSVYTGEAIDESDPNSVMSAEGIAPELTEGEPIATSHAPGFYRSAVDPHNPKTDVVFTAHEKSTKKARTDTGSTAPKKAQTDSSGMSVTDIKQRIRFYKKNVGRHTTKARAQKRKDGEIKSRTANAITNNKQWVEHYTELLKTKTK